MSYKFNDAEHLHELDGQPLTGVSSVGSVLAKPLTYWAAGLALEAFGWTKDKDDDGAYKPKHERMGIAKGVRSVNAELSDEEYLKLLDASYRAHNTKKNEAAVQGTDKHALVEEWVKKRMAGEVENPHNDILPFVSWANLAVKKFLASEMHCYSKTHWVGGIMDIIAELKNGNVAIIDIKSAKDAYPSMFFQCGGYDLLVSENGGYTADGEKVFDLEGKKIGAHIIFPFGMNNPTAKVRYDVDKNREAFLAELVLYRQLNNFNK